MSKEMFSINSPTLKSAINDYPFDFPRYQRNEAWNTDDKIKLCISIFKLYPVGSIVVKKLNDKETYWVLDGRQRYETIKSMQNPETIFHWAKECYKFNAPDEIKSKLKEEISEYLGYEIDETTEQWFIDLTDVISSVGQIKKKRGSLAKSSGFRDPFIYKKFKPNYVVDLGGTYDADPDKLLKWILGSELINKDIDKITAEDVVNEYDIDGAEKEKLLKEINNNILSMKKSLKAVKTIQTVMKNSKLSLIILDEECKSSDEMKIFEIVNTGGKRLNNAQIRSAKKQWNYIVTDGVEEDNINKYRKRLYEAQKLILSDDCVTWDFAATFVDRLDENTDILLSKKYRTMTYEVEASKDKMEYGFKLLSARFNSSVTKEAIDELPEKDQFNWTTNCRDLATEINEISSFLIKNDKIFNHFKKYGFSINSMGQNIAICFTMILIKLWHEYGKTTSRTKYRSLISNIRILLDSFIFDYLSDKWKGSGDSLLKNKLTGDPTIKKVEEEDWKILINGLFNENVLSVGKHTDTKLKILTYYFTAIRNKEVNGNGELVQIDHIIPRSQFLDSTPDDKKKFKDSLINYALLPPNLNKEKSDWMHNLSPADIDLICNFEDLDKKELSVISSPEGLDKLKEMRAHIVEDIISKRKDYTSSSGYWIVK